MNKRCIIHYDGHEKYSKTNDLSVINEKRIKKTKTMRETFIDENLLMRNYNSYNKSRSLWSAHDPML